MKSPTPTRRSAVAGRFYPADPEALLSGIHSYIPPAEKTPAIGCIVPHAGYMYSGHVAGSVYASLPPPQRIILMCPNHTGRGRPLAIMSRGAWETPLGAVSVDSEMANALKLRFPLLEEDAEAHRSEHAAEVQLPFLQSLRPDLTFVPIALGTGRFDILESLGQAVADAVAAQNTPVLIMASSDMNHYENDTITREKDHRAIAPILRLDGRALFDVVMNEDISMCGFGPTVAMLTAAKLLGAQRARLTGYATSADVSGDRERVVGYAGVVVA